MKKYFYILFVSFIGLNSCDKIEDPYEGIEKPVIIVDTTTFCGFAEYDSELNDTTYNDTTSNIRKVLLEEYTGHLCGFCPPESKRLVAKTENELKGKAIVMSIHAANFAFLVPSKGYNTDFTTPEGDDLHERYKGGNSAPSLMMNRTNPPASASQWNGMLDSLDKSGYYNDPVVKFKVRNIYNETIKTGRVDLDIEFLKDFSGTNFVVGVYITEDHILAKQKYYGESPEDVDNYDTVVFPLASRAYSGSAVPLNRFDNIRLKIRLASAGLAGRFNITCVGETTALYKGGAASLAMY